MKQVRSPSVKKKCASNLGVKCLFGHMNMREETRGAMTRKNPYKTGGMALHTQLFDNRR